jgi:translocation and assembly module TamA
VNLVDFSLYLSALFKPGRSLPLLCVLLASTLMQGQEDASPVIDITGAPEELETNIRASLNLAGETCDSSLLRLQRLVPGIRNSARLAAEALGYYESSAAPQFNAGENCWELQVLVRPGRQVMLRDVNITIVADPRDSVLFDPVIGEIGLVSGQPLHHGHYEDLKNRLSSVASDNGYFEARFNRAEISVHPNEYAADVALEFAPGPRYRFGAFSYNKSDALSDDLLDSLNPVREGDFYSTSSLASVRRELDASEYFQQIRISPRLRQAAGQTVPVNIDLDLRPRHSWTSGLGFTTDTGPRARVEYQNRFVNRSGHKLLTDVSLSNVRAQTNGSYIIPIDTPIAHSIGLNVGFINENNDAFESKRFLGGVSLPWDSENGWRRIISLDLQRDDYLAGTDEDVSILTLPGISYTRTLADDLINPSQGWKVFASLKGASDALLSDTSLLQFYATGKHIASFGRGRLLGRVDFGATLINEASELPASLRFYAGGDRSVRGYDFNSLGPVDPVTDAILGGKNLVAGSLEYDYLVGQNWRVALFADTGNSFDNRSDFELKQSAGFGIRWLSPIGPLRVDLAHPFNSDESFRIHITMGPDL